MATKTLKSIRFPNSSDRYVILVDSGNSPILRLNASAVVSFLGIHDSIPQTLSVEYSNDTYYYYLIPNYGVCTITYSDSTTTSVTIDTAKIYEIDKSGGDSGSTTCQHTNTESQVTGSGCEVSGVIVCVDCGVTLDTIVGGHNPESQVHVNADGKSCYSLCSKCSIPLIRGYHTAGVTCSYCGTTLTKDPSESGSEEFE